MNSVILRPTKLLYRNLLHFYTLTVSYQEKKLLIILPFYFQSYQKNVTPRNKSKKVKDLYSGNYKTLMKETDADTNNRKIHCGYMD